MWVIERRPCEEDKYFQFPKNFHFQPSDIFYRLGKDLSLLNCLIAYCLGAVTLHGATVPQWWGSYGNLMEVWSDQGVESVGWGSSLFSRDGDGFTKSAMQNSRQKNNNCKRSKLVFSAPCPPLPWRGVACGTVVVVAVSGTSIVLLPGSRTGN